MKIIYTILFSIFYLTSCVTVPHYIRQRFTYCYNGQNAGIEKLINIDGYYTMGIVSSYNTHIRKNDIVQTINKSDTVYIDFMFWHDSIFQYNFGTHDLTASEYLKRVVENDEKSFFRNYYWGKYVVNNDTIKAQYIDNPYPYIIDTWAAYEIWFKVINKNIIKYICSKPLFRTDEMLFYEAEKNRIYLAATFVPLTIRPDSDCWLKKEDWFWCKNRK